MTKQDELVLGYKIMIFKRKDGSRYIQTKMKGSKTITDSDLGTLSLHLDKVKQDMLKTFKPDVEVETESEDMLNL
jgi:hypothetical protein